MSNTKDKNQQSGDSSKRKNSPITRREIIGAGVVGLAAAATTKSAFANTQEPAAPETGKADPNGRFKDKVVLITGATSGIGKATAYAFAREGAKVFFCGRRTNLGEANAREFKPLAVKPLICERMSEKKAMSGISLMAVSRSTVALILPSTTPGSRLHQRPSPNCPWRSGTTSWQPTRQAFFFR